MKKNHLLKNKLSSYTALACTLLASQQVGAQVHYTDVDPDEVIDQGELFGFDLDDDGTDDFGLTNVLYSGIGAMNVINYVSDGIAGYIGSFFGSTFPFASVIGAGQEIGPSLDFYSTSSGAPLLWGTFAVVGSFGAWDNIVNKYVGLRIKNGADFHYGWARLDVSHTTITLKDYAINQTANAPLNTTVGIEDSKNTFNPTVYSFAEGVHIVLPTGVKSAVVSVFDLSGREVLNTEIYSQADISLKDIASGNYLIRIMNESQVFSMMIAVK